MTHNDLRNKTVFDFCEDNAILAEITGFSKPQENMEYIKGLSPVVHAQLLQSLADKTNNQELKLAAEKLEAKLWDEQNSLSNELGCIID